MKTVSRDISESGCDPESGPRGGGTRNTHNRIFLRINYSSSEKPRAQEKNLRVKTLDFEVFKT